MNQFSMVLKCQQISYTYEGMFRKEFPAANRHTS